MNKRPTVLALDADASTRRFINRALSVLDIDVQVTAEQRDFFIKKNTVQADLYLIGIDVPEGDGLKLTEELCAADRRPVVFLSAHADTRSRLRAFEAGALEYLTKPIHPREFALRIRNILVQFKGRVGPRSAIGTASLSKQSAPAVTLRRFGEWRFDLARRCLYDPMGCAVRLTAAEFALLSALTAAPQQVMAREELACCLGEKSAARHNVRIVDVLVWRLRKKLGDRPPLRHFIATVPSSGYLFAAEVTAA